MATQAEIIEHETPKPWEKQANESNKMYSLFARYRDMGPERSIRQVAIEVGKSKNTLYNYSAKWNWPERVKNYEEHLELLKQQAIEKEIIAMAKRHATGSQALQKTLMMPVEHLLKKGKISPDELEEEFENLSLQKKLALVQRTAQVYQQLTGVERLSRGEPTSIEESKVTTKNEVKVIKPFADSEEREAENDV